MPAYLITGMGGSGKSTIHAELVGRGYKSFDGDGVPSLARWEDAKTGEPVDVDYTKVSWNWNPKILISLLANNEIIFLCGSASNQSNFYPLFRNIFVLNVPPHTHYERLRNRGSAYGKDPALQQELVRTHATLLQEIIQSGGLAIDASGSPERTVDLIISSIRHDD